MPKIHKVEKARKAIPSINVAVGETYYWWKRRFGRSKSGTVVKSKTYPKRQELTSSSYLCAVYDLEDKVNAMSNEEILNGGLEDVYSDLETIKDELEEKLENMPEGLRESSDSGQTLQQRIDATEEAMSEVEEVKSRAEDWYGEHGEKGYDLEEFSAGEGEDDEDTGAGEADDYLAEAEAIVDEFRGISFGG